MRHGEVTNINGAWSDEANAWVSEIIELTGDGYLEVKLSDKGRIVIKKSESRNGPFPKAFISNWSGSEFKIRIYGTTEGRFVIICLTSVPEKITISGI